MSTAQRSPGDGAFVTDHGVEKIGASRLWFEAQLKDRQFSLHGSSRLAQGLKALEQLMVSAATRGTMKFSSAEEAQRFAFDAIGTDFLTKALHRNPCITDATFDKPWRSLRAGDPILTGPTQLQGPVSRPRDLSWELLLASLVATFATNVRMAEPDVVCEFQGKRVGLAAKVFYGSNDGQFLDKIQEGARQLQNQDVDQGFVVVNMVEQFPHSRLFDIFRKAGIADAKVVYELVSGWVDAFLVAHPVSSWEQHLKGMSKLMSVMMFVPTILPLAGMSMPLPYYRIHTFGIIGREDEALLFEQALQLACEDVPSFAPPLPM